MRFSDLYAHMHAAADAAPAASRRFVKTAYKNAIKTISAAHDDRETVTAKKIGELALTAHMKERLIEFSRRRALASSDSHLKAELERIPGIGPKAAAELIAAGVKKPEDLCKAAFFGRLHAATQLFLQKRPERRIPRSLIADLDAALRSPVFDTHVVGSFRRELPFSRDIDIMLVSDEPEALARYVAYVRGILPNLWEYASGPDKASFIAAFKGKNVKLDIFRTPQLHKWSMLLYSTGSKEFNVQMRGLAKKKGYVLNQHGLYKRNGDRVPDTCEKDYFDALGMAFKPPNRR